MRWLQHYSDNPTSGGKAIKRALDQMVQIGGWARYTTVLLLLLPEIKKGHAMRSLVISAS
ncbi:hypothetical protein OA40_16430 [Morganella morganii]|nr:hypothetical protein OA40_16430 [Morganella morganii]